MEITKLISGTDIRGVAVGEKADLTTDFSFKLAQAFVLYLKKSKRFQKIRIAVGRDSRVSGESLQLAFCEGGACLGAEMINFDMCTTPAMYRSLKCEKLNLSAAVMITASHHPSDRNGFKFFISGVGGVSSQILKEIIACYEDEKKLTNKVYIENFDYLSVYKEELTNIIKQKLDTDVACPLLGIHVVVDAGNGAGGFYAELLKELGAWTEGSQFLEPDGNFPNHAPNPENMEAMHSLSKAVIENSADFGVIFDADCDRAAIVDNTGKEINRNRLIALVSSILLDDEPGSTIVTDSVTSSGLAKFIGEWGGEHYRYKRGYKNVIDEALRLNESGINCPLAIETSGHAAFRENDFIDDGMYLSTLLICKAVSAKQEGKDIFDVLSSLEEPVESAEIRLPIFAENFREVGIKTIEKLIEKASECDSWKIAPDNREGVRISFDLDEGINNGWFLVRMSVHDPVMPINVESDVRGGVVEMLGELYEVIKDIKEIDSSKIYEYIKRNQEELC